MCSIEAPHLDGDIVGQDEDILHVPALDGDGAAVEVVQHLPDHRRLVVQVHLAKEVGVRRAVCTLKYLFRVLLSEKSLKVFSL